MQVERYTRALWQFALPLGAWVNRESGGGRAQVTSAQLAWTGALHYCSGGPLMGSAAKRKNQALLLLLLPGCCLITTGGPARPPALRITAAAWMLAACAC